MARDSTSSSAHVPAGVREQPRALADDHGEGEQGHLVDKVVVEQPPEQGAAAVHLQLASRLGLQLADGGRESLERTVVFAHRGSVSVVDATYLGFVFNAVQIGLSPGSSHAPQVPAKMLVGPPAEQERVGALVDLVHDRPGFVVEVGPSAALEYAALVLLRSTPGPCITPSTETCVVVVSFMGSSFLRVWTNTWSPRRSTAGV